jgi:hypothetical protein
MIQLYQGAKVSFTFILIYYFYLFLSLFCAEDGTQGLDYARQVFNY